MGRDNTSSVDSGSGHKLADMAGQKKSAIKAEFQSENSDSGEQVVNARKVANLSLAKAKAKKRAKLAKASRKKNK